MSVAVLIKTGFQQRQTFSGVYLCDSTEQLLHTVMLWRILIKSHNTVTWPPVIFRIKADDDETTTHIAH